MPVKISEKHFISLADKKTFEQYLQIKRHELSTYSFANIYIWKCLFEIFWYLIDDSLCVFFNNSGGCFMYLSPLSADIKPEIVKQCFKIMDEINHNSKQSRIENVEEAEIEIYQNMGLIQKNKSGDYLYVRTKLAELRGNEYKSKRAEYNNFIKNSKYKYRFYSKADEQECIVLLKNWIDNRKESNNDQLYQYMLDDIHPVQQSAIKNYLELDLTGRVVEVDGAIQAYTFGYKLNLDTFCVMFEVVNSKYKGIAQFVFRELSKEMRDYIYINAMDDSGLKNIAKVKNSYKPYEMIKNSLITRKP